MGMANQVRNFITGKTDLFFYEPGICFWDYYSAAQILAAHRGSMCDLRGQPIIFTGNTTMEDGLVVMKEHVPKDIILESIASVYP